MAKRKVKRYDGEDGSVTSSEDSNAGMKEAYDEAALERANASEESQAIMNEAKGDAMLKAMRDEAARPKPRPASTSVAKPKVTDTGDETSRLLKRVPKPKVTDTGDETSRLLKRAPKPPPKVTDTGDETSRLLKRVPKPSTPSALSRFFSSIRERGMRSNPDAYSKGGSASSRADGIAQRGKTRGKMY